MAVTPANRSNKKSRRHPWRASSTAKCLELLLNGQVSDPCRTLDNLSDEFGSSLDVSVIWEARVANQTVRSAVVVVKDVETRTDELLIK